MTLRERLRLVCNDAAANGDRCILAAHSTDILHDAGNGHRWGARDPFVPEWLRLARVHPNGLARDETGRAA